MAYKKMFISTVVFVAGFAAAEPVDLTPDQQEAFIQIDELNQKCLQKDNVVVSAIVGALTGRRMGMSQARARNCMDRDELIKRMKSEGVCEETAPNGAIDRRCILKEAPKPLDPAVLAAIAERERQSRPPALDKASCKKWFKRAETVRQMERTCVSYIDDDLPTDIGNALSQRGCNETLSRDEFDAVRQSVTSELQSEYDKTRNAQMFCATMINYRHEVYRMFHRPINAPRFIEK